MRRLFVLLLVMTALVGASAPTGSAGDCAGDLMKDPATRAFVLAVIHSNPAAAREFAEAGRDCRGGP